MLNVIGSLKGGSGKSTVTFNLAVWLASRGESVAVIDADPQATLTDVLEVREEEGWSPDVTQLPVQTLSNLPALQRYDHILVDVGTASMDSLKVAITLADRLLIPVPPSQADIWSVQRFLRFVSAQRGSYLPIIQCFINRADPRRAMIEADEAAEVLDELPMADFIPERLNQRTSYLRSISEGMAVFEQKPDGKAAEEFERFARAIFPQVL